MGLSHTSATQFMRKFPIRRSPNHALTTLMHSGNLIVGASLALVFWSYIPLYTLPIAIGGYLLKVPIEVRDPHQRPRRSRELTDGRMFQERMIVEDPELGNEYKIYKLKVPYKIIPYIW